jgi:signal transduction histidine kinase/Tfp pilus assembly protein PilF
MIYCRQYFHILFFLLFPFVLAAQTTKSDSLIQKLATTESDTARFHLLCRISQNLRPTDPETAYDYALEALELGVKLDDADMQAEAHIALGNCLDFQGKYLEEMNHFMKGLALYESTTNEKGLGSAYNAMGTLLYNMENYEKALEYYRKAYVIREKMGKKDPIAASLNNIGIAHLDLGNLDSARYYFNAALKINQETDNKLWGSTNLHNLGQVSLSEGNYDTAIVLLEMALHMREEIDSRVGMTTSHLALGEVRFKKGDYAESEQEYKKAYFAGKEMKSPRVIRKAARGLAMVYTRLHEHQKATLFFEEYLAADDSLESSSLTSSITSGLLDNEKEKQEKELKATAETQRILQEAVIQRHQFYFWLAAAGLLLMLLLALFLFFLYRNRRRMTQLLETKVEERTRKLLHVNAELDKFIYQSSHDLRSPITSIRGLADIALSPAGHGDTPRYLALIKDRAEHMDGVYSNLIHTMNIRDRVVKKEIVQLAPLFESMEEELQKCRNKHQLRFEYHLATNTIETDPLLMLQIFRSIALNASDFARPQTQPVCIVTATTEGRGWKITFTDNGPGIAPGVMPKIFEMFFRGSNQSKGSGLGLYNAKLAADKLGLNITAESRPEGGTIFILQSGDPQD